MSLPTSDRYWIDTDLSRELPSLRQRGENQSLEYKRELPKQTTDLAKEIAAFATSNDGLILLGVSDSGELVGLSGVGDLQGRDSLLQRVEGICRAIKPPVHPQLLWAAEGDHTVLVVRVLKGREPLYYVNSQPYIRRSTSSRPAEPAEVVDAVRTWLESEASGTPGNATDNLFLTTLATILVKVMRWGDTDSKIRNLSPWVEQWTHDAKSCAANLRDLAAEDAARKLTLVERLENLAILLDGIVKFRHVLGGGPSFDDASDEVGNAAKTVMNQVITPMPVNDNSRDTVRKDIEKSARKLADAWARAEQNPFGGEVEEAQQEAGRIGRRLMEWSYFPLNFLAGDKSIALLDIGKRLLELEAEFLYYDGGDSQRRVTAAGVACANDLTTFIQQI